MARVTVSDAALWSGGKYYGPDIQLCRSWKNDSREVCPGDAFVALKGGKTDGHNFVHSAVDRGAKLLLVNSDKLDELSLLGAEYSGISVIAVDNTEKALAAVAKEYLRLHAPKVIGITGSVGKTTTKELIVSLLQSVKKVHSTIRSFNTVIGCSLTILAMPEETEVLVLEFGTNHFGEIREMVSLFPPHLAIITEVAPAHLEGFKDLDGVLSAKMEIFESEKLEMIVYNSDNKPLKKQLSYKYNNIEKIGVGREEESGLKILGSDISLAGDEAQLISSYSFEGSRFELKTHLFGVQHSYNVGYAFLAARMFGAGTAEANEKLSVFLPSSGRGKYKRLPQNLWIIDEAYNANPRSMRAAIENTLNIAGSSALTPYAVLGGMRELGDSSAYWHQDMIQMLIPFGKVILLGEEWFDESIVIPDNTRRYRSFEEITSLPDSLSLPDSVILIKGSNSYGLKRLVALFTEGRHVY
ncbi:MAG: UDP-N-acetylmuramoyl-tripeptide--D-alanyl-D-alanine ligase [Synergistaceae bacterium]|nr:UDP-N-acetylmuramoyl-tripeptide--D-alanyl-D-alanine ligase [Synergistaceae bacterium]